MAKLSPAQADVIDRMTNGWELGVSVTMNGRAWLQKGGVGKGGETKAVSISTLSALSHLGLIVRAKDGFPTVVYSLTPAAKAPLKGKDHA